jgi:hypothetical protein
LIDFAHSFWGYQIISKEKIRGQGNNQFKPTNYYACYEQQARIPICKNNQRCNECKSLVVYIRKTKIRFEKSQSKWKHLPILAVKTLKVRIFHVLI